MKKSAAFFLVALCGAATVGVAAQNGTDPFGPASTNPWPHSHPEVKSSNPFDYINDDGTVRAGGAFAEDLIGPFPPPAPRSSIALVVFFGGLFLLAFISFAFISKRRKQIASAGEDAVVSALASAVRVKRKVSGFRDRLKSKVDEKLEGR